MAAALGLTLSLAGILTHPLVTLGGLPLAAIAFLAWARQVMPREEKVAIPLEERGPAREVAPVPVAPLETGGARHRARLPLEMHPYRSGLSGGLAGAAAMAAVAIAYGVLAKGSVWLPINLLAGVVLPPSPDSSQAALLAFDANALAIGTVVHLITSLFVGLAFAAMLPMLPGRPLLWGGIVAPLIWTSLLWACMGILNPLLRASVDWSWFAASQVAFGLAAGAVVSRSSRISTRQYRSPAERIGVEATGAPPKVDP
jgi:hypothetical protein